MEEGINLGTLERSWKDSWSILFLEFLEKDESFLAMRVFGKAVESAV